MSAADLLDFSSEAAEARAAKKPIVALESTIITHGMPYPHNVETARSVEEAARKMGAVPATIAVVDGRLRVGLEGQEIERLGQLSGGVVKASRRDLALVAARKGSAIAALPDPARPQSEADSYAIQDAVGKKLGEKFSGWKVGISPEGGHFAAPIYGSRIAASPASIPAR